MNSTFSLKVETTMGLSNTTFYILGQQKRLQCQLHQKCPKIHKSSWLPRLGTTEGGGWVLRTVNWDVNKYPSPKSIHRHFLNLSWSLSLPVSLHTTPPLLPYKRDKPFYNSRGYTAAQLFCPVKKRWLIALTNICHTTTEVRGLSYDLKQIIRKIVILA